MLVIFIIHFIEFINFSSYLSFNSITSSYFSIYGTILDSSVLFKNLFYLYSINGLFGNKLSNTKFSLFCLGSGIIDPATSIFVKPISSPQHPTSLLIAVFA